MSEQEKQDKPKIIVDSDWKEQAKKEKEELARKADEETRQKQGDQQGPPKPDFITHCASLATQAMISMGAIAHPLTGQAQPDLAQARYVIDTLEMLKGKTEGNLSDEESRTIESLVSELKLVWVQVTQGPQQAPEDPENKPEGGQDG